MEAYIFRADIYCKDCAAKLALVHGYEPATGGDSDEFVCGPYPDGGGEADSPNHCGKCGLFLENALTTDGAEYVAGVLETYYRNGLGDPDTIREWRWRYCDYPEVSKVIEANTH